METKKQYRCVACSTSNEQVLTNGVLVDGKYKGEKTLCCEYCGSIELEEVQ